MLTLLSLGHSKTLVPVSRRTAIFAMNMLIEVQIRNVLVSFNLRMTYRRKLNVIVGKRKQIMNPRAERSMTS
ncbi:hypothetical protein SISSUDRAFT_665809 [Sistotremastrum suecicum HHB10207 ss-3]|uniref:Uncharacterized protein n=1 Tax=Sistotremastrum suecicum HHB10207 ss-3 TaxID=1314776 RepID=A0A166E3G9_9AGAM|nr:hypothetical protein SISSUDRAFT_665809 [Sistotremastrum suecicum HHB10207 ss-3]